MQLCQIVLHHQTVKRDNNNIYNQTCLVDLSGKKKNDAVILGGCKVL